MIVTTGASIDQNSVIFRDLWRPYAPHAALVIVHAQTDRGQNLWATAFANAISAQGDEVLTVTDRPTFDDRGCRIGKIYQSPLGTVDVKMLIQALETGRPPAVKSK